MHIQIDVGTVEKHCVEFRRDHFFGVTKVVVDGEVIHKTVIIASYSLLKTYTIDVGTTERHSVRIEHKRPQFMAALRKHTYRVFIDDALVVERRGF